MSEFRARISRVRMKNGGADVRVLDREPTNPEGENWHGKIVENARTIAEIDNDLAGYIVVGIFDGGATSFAYRYDPDRCHIPRALFPAWVAEIIRRDIITEIEAENVFDRNFEWAE